MKRYKWIARPRKPFRCARCNDEIQLKQNVQPVSSVDVGDAKDRVLRFHGNCWSITKGEWSAKYHVMKRRIRIFTYPEDWQGQQIIDNEGESEYSDDSRDD